MISKIKQFLTLTSSLILLALPIAAPAVVSAASAGCKSNITQNIAQGASSTGSDVNCESNDSTNNIGNLAKNIVNIFSFIVGAVAVLMIIYGGFRYITSGGDSGSVGNAKNTLIYAIVGLIIVALAQIIVQFVLSQGTTAVNG